MEENEKSTLLNRLVDATRECEKHYFIVGQILTECHSCVSCVCQQLEEILFHGIKAKPSSSIATLKNVTGLQLPLQMNEEPTYWDVISSHLTKHEIDRFSSLYHITSNIGRGRAWLRCSLNEHSLQRMLEMILSDTATLESFYSPHSFMLDKNKASKLPGIVGGLCGVMFSIKFDDPSLNNSSSGNLVKPHSHGSMNMGSSVPLPVLSHVSTIFGAEVGMNEFPEALTEVASCNSVSARYGGKKKDQRKVKKAKIIQFSIKGDQLIGCVKRHEVSGPDYSCSMGKQDYGQHSDDGLSMVPSKNKNPGSKVLVSGSDDNKDLSNTSGHCDIDKSLRICTLQSEKKPTRRSFHDQYICVNEFKQSLVLASNNSAIECSGEEFPQEVSRDFLENDLVKCASDKVHFTDVETVFNEQSTQGGVPLQGSFSSPLNYEAGLDEANDLQKALVVLLQRKDELVDEINNLKSLLEIEKGVSKQMREENRLLKAEIEEFRQSQCIDSRRQLQENEVLRSQLKRYVGAVHALQHGKVTAMPNHAVEFPDESSDLQNEGPNAEKVYEQKLVEVTEMHGELMEFTESLNTRLLSALSLIHKMHDELVALRGPLPCDNVIKSLGVDGKLLNFSSLPSLPETLINVWVPSAFLQGSGPDSHHVYQIYACLRDDEWNVYRRYSDFHALHDSLVKSFPEMKKFGFPKKKGLGNRSSKLVEERRKAFQGYLRLVLHTLIQKNSRFSADPSKKTLLHILPFFNDTDDPCRVIVGLRSKA